MTTDELIAKLSDPWWRITSGALYKIMIKGDDGEESLVADFIPNEFQLEMLEGMHKRNVILKARQLGFTTLIAIYFLDCALFKDNIRAGMIAQSDEVAKTLFRDKVKFAYDNLPEFLRLQMPLARDSQSELLFSHNNSSLRVATSMRAGTIHYLHVSEFGKICAKFPDRATEVMTGSVPAVPSNGTIFIESTAEGQDGEFYKMCERSQKITNLNRTDFKFHFFPWWRNKRYTLDQDVIITEKDHQYFDKIESITGCELTIGQRSWWCATRDATFSGDESMMWQEYPSTPSEAFQQSSEGCYYSVQMTSVRKQGRICTINYRPGIPVNTFWDIGRSDGTAIWFHQKVGQYNNFIKFIEGWDEPYNHFVAEIQKTGWVFGTHYLPHDANHRRQGALENSTPKEMLEQLGLSNVEIVPVVENHGVGIELTRGMFPTCWFDETNCKEGINHLDNYKKAWSQTNGRWLDHHKKDIHTEAADAFRQFAQAQAMMDDASEEDYEEYYSTGSKRW